MNYYPNYNMQANGNYIPNYPMPTPPVVPAQNNNGPIWVQGEAGAKSYLVAANNTVMLMDSEGERFYLKSADASGMPTLRTFVYHEDGKAPESGPEYVTQEQIREIVEKMEAIEKKLGEEIKKNEKFAKIKKAVTEDE